MHGNSRHIILSFLQPGMHAYPHQFPKMDETIGKMKERIIIKHFSGILQKIESNTTEECDLDSSTENPLSFH